MKYLKSVIPVLLINLLGPSCNEHNPTLEHNDYNDMLVRIAEIEIDSAYTQAYFSILKEEAEASVRLEPGVICIYPMYQVAQPTAIRLLEIYADQEAYESHLKTPHFLHYKTETLHMIKSLRLTDVKSIDEQTMSKIFIKLNKN